MIIYKLYRKKKTLREKYLYLEFFRSIFPYIRTEYGSPYQSDCGKIRTRKIPNKGTFHAVEPVAVTTKVAVISFYHLYF